MVNKIKTNEQIIMDALNVADKKRSGLSLSDMTRVLPLSRCQIRTSVAFLLGARKIEEQIYGRAKVYILNEGQYNDN